jgi:ABC-type nitrate/sulfonate/bicarbonate transport system ATPase subunit
VFLAQRAVMFSRRPARIVADRAIEFSGERAAELRGLPAYHELVEQLYQDLQIAEEGG